jgi:hypothetical protein
MPLWKFRSLEEAERHLASLRTTPDASLRTALFLGRISEAGRRGIRISQRGIHRYRTIAEAETDRERYALEQLRAADASDAD